MGVRQEVCDADHAAVQARSAAVDLGVGKHARPRTVVCFRLEAPFVEIDISAKQPLPVASVSRLELSNGDRHPTSWPVRRSRPCIAPCHRAGRAFARASDAVTISTDKPKPRPRAPSPELRAGPQGHLQAAAVGNSAR